MVAVNKIIEKGPEVEGGLLESSQKAKINLLSKKMTALLSALPTSPQKLRIFKCGSFSKYW